MRILKNILKTLQLENGDGFEMTVEGHEIEIEYHKYGEWNGGATKRKLYAT